MEEKLIKINYFRNSSTNYQTSSDSFSNSKASPNYDLPGTDETFFGLRMNLTSNPVKFGKKDYKSNMITQMTQPVQREYDVLLERKTGWGVALAGN